MLPHTPLFRSQPTRLFGTPNDGTPIAVLAPLRRQHHDGRAAAVRHLDPKELPAREGWADYVRWPRPFMQITGLLCLHREGPK